MAFQDMARVLLTQWADLVWKSHPRNAVIFKKISYSNASDIYEFLMEHFCADKKKHYFVLDKSHIEKKCDKKIV